MVTVYKYPLPLTDYVRLELPVGAVPLAFRFQGEVPTMWCMVEPDRRPSIRLFRLVTTGEHVHEKTGNLRFIGTDMKHDGRFVMHLFEVIG